MATVEWTVLEKLLLSQAVYKYGEDNWFQIARNLKHHALLDRPSDYFNQKNCSLQYYLMVEEMNKQRQPNQDMPVVVQIARELYTLRLEELKKAIGKDEERFLQLVSEIDDIRAGKWDNQLLGLPENTSTTNTPTAPTPTNNTTTTEDNNNTNSPHLEDNNTPMTEEQKEPEETIVQEEEAVKVEADNLEDELRVQASPSPPSPKVPAESSSPEYTTPEITADAPNVNIIKSPVIESVESMTPPLKRAADDTDLEPEAKRQRTEELSTSDAEREEESLAIDTSRTDFLTDASQATTPTDTHDSMLREGTESVAESESNAATPTTERKRGQSMTAGRDDQRHKSWLKNINLLWREIANHKNGAMFMNPIKETIAPHYYDIVKRPMDMKTIKNRIRDGLINTTTEFERDVVLMLNNSLMYNKEGTEVYQMAREMLDDAAEQIKIFKTADTDSSASSHTRAAAAKEQQQRKSIAIE